MQSVGEFLGAIIFGTLSRRVYIKYLLLVALFLAFGGGILFGVGLNGWMLLFGKPHSAMSRATGVGGYSLVMYALIMHMKRTKFLINYS